MNKGIVIGSIIGVLLLLGGYAWFGVERNGNAAIQFEGDAILHKTPTCGCCAIWSGYASKSISFTTKEHPDLSAVKEKFNIPRELQSCHTMEIGGYFVEGHIPLEAIEKLMKERPDIAGIAMPGMPSGSPGMPGAKTGDFVIQAVKKDGTYYEFMRI